MESVAVMGCHCGTGMLFAETSRKCMASVQRPMMNVDCSVAVWLCICMAMMRRAAISGRERDGKEGRRAVQEKGCVGRECSSAEGYLAEQSNIEMWQRWQEEQPDVLY